jgi:uncharacterized repeat protein (TIGR03803 family)
MKSLNVIIIVAFFTVTLGFSQQQLQFYGTCTAGGKYGNGTVFRFSPEADTIEVLTHFDRALGQSVSFNSFVEHSTGILLGCTEFGGINNSGVIFSYDFVTNNYEKLFEFESSTSGIRPNGLLIDANNGFYYGTTASGGLYNKGVLFRFDPDNKIFEKLHDFNGTDGNSALTQLFLSDQNKIYGTTRQGGTGLSGVIFEYDICSESFQVLYNFPYSAVNGYYPSGVIKATNGRLYGTTIRGGFADSGVFFEFDLISGILTKKGDLITILGQEPYGVPIQIDNGKIIGTSNNGVIYQFDPITDVFSVATQFTQTNTNRLLSTFIKGPNGNLYCPGSDMSFSGYGSIIEYNPLTQEYIKRHTFSGGLLGSNPGYRLFLASNGKMYGFTILGGSEYEGVIYEFNPSNNSVVIKVQLNAPNEGQTPYGELIHAPDGKYYGTTFQGGIYNKGTIFCVNPLSKDFEIVHHFTGDVGGKEPRSGMIIGDDGNLYGMTSTGGSGSNGGVIYKLDISTQEVSELYNFIGTNGLQPWGNLLKVADGTFYGLVKHGGLYSNGVIFHFNPVSLDYQVLNHLQQPYYNGKYPLGHFTEGNNGKLYTVTYDGGAGTNTYKGTIIEVDTNLLTSSVIHSFDNSGFGPGKSLIMGTDGNLYGIASTYGTYYGGLIWRYDISSSSYSIIHEFDDINGKTPSGSFIEGPNQVLYGVTSWGGTNNLGTIYSYDIPNDTLIKMFDFNSISGENPSATMSSELVNVEFNINDLPDSLCLNTTLRIGFETNGIFSSSNQFVIELSDESGSLLSPIEIGSSLGYNDRFVNITIPNGLDPSNLYRMRVKSTVPEYIGSDNGFDLTIGIDDQAPVPPMISDIFSICTLSCLKAPIALDNCGQQIEGYTNYSFPISSIGNHQIEWIFIDAAGNQSSSFQTVTINPDNVAPLPLISVLDSIHSYCSISELNVPLAIDDCGEIIEGVPDVSFPITLPGVHNVLWSFADPSGNVGTQSQIITIEQMPVVTIENLDPTLIADVSPNEFELQWMDCSNNQIIQYPSSEVFNAPYNGSFALQINSAIGCQYNSDCIQILNALNINELNNVWISLYPNPNTGDLKVSFNEGLNFKGCWLTDMHGRRINPEKISKEGTNLEINIESVKNGIYFIILEFEEGVFQEKVSKVYN